MRLFALAFALLCLIPAPSRANCLDTLIQYRTALRKARAKNPTLVKTELDYLISLEKNLPECFRSAMGRKLKAQRVRLLNSHRIALENPPTANEPAPSPKDDPTTSDPTSRNATGLSLTSQDTYNYLSKSLGTGLTLNLFFPLGLGSWVVGDHAGGGTGLAVQAIGYIFLSAGGALILPGLVIAGAIVAGIGWIIPLITVSIFVPRFNRALKQKLGLGQQASLPAGVPGVRYVSVLSF